MKGWSGKTCTLHGEVLYGTTMSLKSVRAPRELLYATSEGFLPTDGNQMAVVTSSAIPEKDLQPTGQSRWQVLGPPGTSDNFLRGRVVTDGSIVRLRHVATGHSMQVDHNTPAVVRRDLKQVALSAEQEASKEAFYVLVDRRHERAKFSGKDWGIGSQVVFVHCASGYVLASSGEKLPVRVATGHRFESEVHAQAHIPNAQGQFWSIEAHQLPSAVPAVSMATNTIVRLIAPPTVGAPPMANGELSDTCYLAMTGGGGIDCVRSTQGYELWVLLPRKADAASPKRAGGESDAMRVQREAAEGNNTLVHTSRFTLTHGLTMGSLQVIRKPDGKKTVGVAGEVAADSKQADCLQVSLEGGQVSTPWVSSAAASMFFCGTRLSLSLGNKLGTWLAEVVETLPAEAADDDVAAALGELSMKRGLFTAAANHYSTALQKRTLRGGDDADAGVVPTHMLHFKRAIVRTHTGQNAAAIWDLEQSIRLQPNFLEALLYRSRILLTLGKWKDASKGFRHIVKSSKAKDTTVYRAKQYQGILRNVSKTLTKAEEAISVAKEAYGNVDGARCTIGAEDRNVLIWARGLLTSVLEVAPESVPVRYLRAETSLLANDLASVKTDATWTIRMDGSNPHGHFLRAQAHHMAMDDDLALEFYRWCLKLDHDHAGCRIGIKSMKALSAIYTYANIRFRSGDFEGALEQFAIGIELAPGHCSLVALMHLQRCRCFIYLNEPKTAQSECALSYKHDASLEDATYLLKNAVELAANYQRVLEEEVKQKEEEEKQKEAEETKKRRMQEEILLNSTNVTIFKKEWITEEEKMEARLKNLPICEQHFFRLNMSNSTHPKPDPETNTNDVKRAYRKASMVWHPDKHKGNAAKARAEKKFQEVVEAYELLGDEKQLQLCLKGQEPTKEPGSAGQDQQPPEPPKPGRPPEEAAPEEPPVAAHLAWTQHHRVGGLLGSVSHRRAMMEESLIPEVLYSLTMGFTDRTDGTVSSLSGLSAWGSPDHILRCDFDSDAEESEGNKYETRDEFGGATAGDQSRESSSGKNEGKVVNVPATGGLSLSFAAPLGTMSSEEKRHIDIEFQEYQISDMLSLDEGEKGMVDLRFGLDNREGVVYIYLAVTRHTLPDGKPALRLDTLTVNISPGYWTLKKSIARKRKVAPMGGLEAAESSSLHHAFDSDLGTWFKSSKPLVQNMAMVVDMDMIYQLTKIEVKEQSGYECVSCKIEVSCDQKQWWPVHTFTAGPGEVVEWTTEAEEEQDSMGFMVQGTKPTMVLARFVRIIATAPTPAPPPRQDANGQTVHMPAFAWHVQEVDVFGEELGESLTADAPVWLGYRKVSGGLPPHPTTAPPLDAQTDHPPSAATDANLNTGFRSLVAPIVGHTLMLDLQEVHLLALVELYQPAGRHCANCAIEHSVRLSPTRLLFFFLGLV